MSIVVKIIGSSTPGVLPIEDGLSFEDVCIQCCRDLEIFPASRHLFALRNVNTKLYASPSDLLQGGDEPYELRLRFWPSLINISKIGHNALHYLYRQVCEEFVEEKISALNYKNNQSVALGLAVTAMYCHMKDFNVRINDVLTNYRKFVPKTVRRNSNLKYSTESLKNRLSQLVHNPPGETWFCKQEFLKTVALTASDYAIEKYPVKVEKGEELIEFELIIQPMNVDQPGVKLQSIKKKIPSEYVCSIEEICFVSIRKSDKRMEISRINGVPHYFLMEDEDSMKSCVGALNGYYRLMEKWTFDLCGELVTPSLVKLKSFKCHGPVGDSFAYEKLRTKRQNKHGCYLLRESHIRYDEYYLDICMEDGQPATTFSIVKTADGAGWTFAGLDCQSCSNIRELLAICGNEKQLGIPGFELKECLPSSENDISELLLCRLKPIEFEMGLNQNPFTQLPVCIPTQSIQLYVGAGFQCEFQGRFTTVHRGVWRRNQDEQIQIVHKLLKHEYRQSHSQAFLESVQKSMFWRSETLTHVFGIVLDVNLRVIMEYLPIGPLDEYLRDHDLLPIIDLVEAATNLAKALFYLEENGFVHGKVRCRNLMVASHTATCIRVKLTDPGISLYTDEELPWIPTELYNSLELVSRRSTADIWACGTCMWEIFSYGAKPCNGFSKVKMIQGFMSGWRLPRPEKCLGEIYHIMIGTWNPDISLRPKAQSVMRDINQILYEVYNSRRSNVYEQVSNHHHRSLNGSMASGLTEATTLRALSEDRDTISFQFEDQSLQDTSINFMLSNITLNGGSSLQYDDEGSELVTTIYELEKKKLELGQLIGQGFYAEVRMGVIRHSDGTEETVAVKLLKTSTFNNPDSVDLQSECTIMKNLNHPNIVEIKAIVSEPTMLVMEYFPMGSLLAYLRTQKETINDQQLLKFATDIAEGMAYLGENNIVHRDLAARNILVATEDLVKISDFGLARQVGYNGYYAVRDFAQKLPIPWYAPESLDHWKFSVQSDVWSFGVTLYEMFSRGEEPNLSSVSADHTLLLRALKQGRRLPRPNLCPPVIYRDLMQPCWNAEASQRPSFKTLLDNLRCVANQL